MSRIEFAKEDPTATAHLGGKWARWDWQDAGPGKWHGIAKVGLCYVNISDDLKGAFPGVQLACGRVRPLPSRIEASHGDPVCAECLTLDGLRKRLETDVPLDDMTALPKELVNA